MSSKYILLVFVLTLLLNACTPAFLMPPTPTPTLTQTPVPTSTSTPTATATPTSTPTLTPTPTATATPMVFKNHRDARDYLYANNLCVMHNDVPNPISSWDAYLAYTNKVLAVFKSSPEYMASGLEQKIYPLSSKYFLGTAADGGCWIIWEETEKGYLAMWYENTDTTWTRVIVQEK